MASIATSKFKPYAEYLKALPTQELFDLEEAAASLGEHPGWVKLVSIMRIGQERIDEVLMNDDPGEKADYTRLLGFKAGLEAMPNAVQAIALAAQRRDEEKRRIPQPEVEELAPDGLTPVS